MSKIQLFHKASRNIRGLSKIHAGLPSHGERFSVNRAGGVLCAPNIQPNESKLFLVTTDFNNTMRPASDRLQTNSKTAQPNQAWVVWVI